MNAKIKDLKKHPKFPTWEEITFIINGKAYHAKKNIEEGTMYVEENGPAGEEKLDKEMNISTQIPYEFLPEELQLIREAEMIKEAEETGIIHDPQFAYCLSLERISYKDALLDEKRRFLAYTDMIKESNNGLDIMKDGYSLSPDNMKTVYINCRKAIIKKRIEKEADNARNNIIASDLTEEEKEMALTIINTITDYSVEVSWDSKSLYKVFLDNAADFIKDNAFLLDVDRRKNVFISLNR